MSEPTASSFHPTLVVRARGRAVLQEPLTCRDDAFTHAERAALGLEGLLPDRVSTLEEQVARAYAQITSVEDPLQRYLWLAELESRNTVLFYALLTAHVEEMMPLVYTPTVGAACERWSDVACRPRGLWITPSHRGRIRSVLGAGPAGGPDADVKLVVLTDGERILGLGDLGAGGMGIPIGKLALYCLGAGFHPAEVLPITLDVGTDRAELRESATYVGVRAPRLRGNEYLSLLDELVEALFARYPRVLLQFEDFKKENAITILERYRSERLCFNDDIEGTAAVAVAGVVAASRKTGVPMKDQRIVILGAGAAGSGIATLLRAELAMNAGLSADALVRAVAVLDSKGLLVEGRRYDESYKEKLAWPERLVREVGLDPAGDLSLLACVRAIGPTALVGTSGQANVFSEDVVRAMAERTSMPAIFPLSNPNSASEADPRYLVEWCDGNAVIATGSPFPSVDHEGKTLRVAQGNNVWIFPGVGLGVLAAEATRLNESLFAAAAKALAEAVEPADLAEGALYPRLTRLREVTLDVARGVARAAVKAGLAPRRTDRELDERIEAMRWTPRYPTLRW